MFKHKLDIQRNRRLEGEERVWAMPCESATHAGWEGRIFGFRWFWERRVEPLRLSAGIAEENTRPAP